MNDRLLTEKELDGILHMVELLQLKDTEGCLKVHLLICEKQDSKTLETIGKQLIEASKQGRIPNE